MTEYEIASLWMIRIQTIFIVIAGVFAGLAYWQTRKISKEQSNQTIKLHNEQQHLTERQFKQQEYWEKQQLKLTERQAYLDIITHTKEIRHLDLTQSQKALEDNAVHNANGLEVIAIAWKLRIFDRMILYQMYGKLFIDIYREIEQAGQSEAIDPIIQNFPIATEVYNEWVKNVDNLS